MEIKKASVYQNIMYIRKKPEEKQVHYIDYDGVIRNTFPNTIGYILDTYGHDISKEELEYYVTQLNIRKAIQKSEIINDAMYYLKHANPEYNKILTKCGLSYIEEIEKVKDLRSHNITLDVICMSLDTKKHEVVIPKNHILTDDTVHNLDGWHQSGGICYYFDTNNTQTDEWGNTNTKYQTVTDLSHILKK